MKMEVVKNFIKFLVHLARIQPNLSSNRTYKIFFNYLLIKIEELYKMEMVLNCIPDEVFIYLIMKHGKCNEHFVDRNLYILCNSKAVDRTNQWFYLCSKNSKKRYKVALIFSDDMEENILYTSETMKFNVSQQLGIEDSDYSSYFLIPEKEESETCAGEMTISLITSPHDCPNDLISDILKKFFTMPKYLRQHDIFKIDVRKYEPQIKYCISDAKLDFIYFIVNSLKSENGQSNGDGNFVVYGKTTLIQEANAHAYLPQKCLCDIRFNTEKFCSSWPMALKEPLNQLQECISPFLNRDMSINVKPVFLLEGPMGSGKSRLIKIAAETLGLHLFEADFAEIQSLTSAQTEAKLRNILHEAENCVPCILMLQNIQIFGLNSEGQKDKRVLASFNTEIKKLYHKKLKYPVIIIATSTESEISIDSDRIFIEKIVIGHLEKDQRCEILSWLLEKKGLKHQVDFSKIAMMCSDYVFADFEALVSYALKKHSKKFKESELIELSDEDFIHACEYMQSIFSDEIGAPRVPKVYWEDIGGLADLKREIMRRIEMPLLNIPGMGRSGLLLYGPPGTGKTLLAKAVATECQLHFLSVKGPELLNMYVGQSEKNVRQVFERARSAAPCIIFFDELDSLAPNRGQSGDSGGVMDRVVSQLLAEMDGLESTGSISIIAATNRPDLIDPALLRPGRFDKMLYVGIYSDSESQISVLKALTRKFKMERDGNELQEIVGKLPENLTGADLYSVCSNAWLRAVRRTLTSGSVEGDDVIVKVEDFLHAGRDLVPSVSKEEMVRYEKLRKELSRK